MVRDLFGNILAEIGQALKIPDLHPGKDSSCLVKMPSGVTVQFELDKKGEALLIGSEIGQLQAGRYRENVFREALKANGMPPLNGIFAFSKKAEKLVLFMKIPLKDYHADKLLTILTPFLEKAQLWRDAIARGDIPVASQTSNTSGMFGLKR